MPKRKTKGIGEIPQLLKIKCLYFFVDKKLRIKVRSREVFNNGKKVVHYPFRKDGVQKYKSIKKIIYLEMPDNLPRGFLKDWSNGYGFTRVYSPLIYELESKFGLTEVVVGKNLATKVEGTKLFVNATRLDSFYPKIETLLEKQRNDKGKLVNDVLALFFPGTYKKSKTKYTKNSLFQFIKQNIDEKTSLSEADTQALFEVASRISKKDFSDSRTSVLKTRNKIDEVYLEEVVAKFERLLKLKNMTKQLENKWQTFFTVYNWIFSQLFSFPVLIFKDQAYAGGKNIDNRGAKIADFIYKNNLTNNIAFIEIKTHKTDVLVEKPYRGVDVFAPSKDMGGAINQVLDQRGKFQKDFYSIKGNSKDKDFETYNSKCIVVIGAVGELSPEKKGSFELMRSNSRDVEVIAFDEVLEKIKGLETLLFGDKKTKAVQV